MTQIRCIYSAEPKFPATDQHPDAVRYQVGKNWVDAIGGEPTQAEIDAVLNPPPRQDTTEQKLALIGLTVVELKAALAQTTTGG